MDVYESKRVSYTEINIEGCFDYLIYIYYNPVLPLKFLWYLLQSVTI